MARRRRDESADGAEALHSLERNPNKEPRTPAGTINNCALANGAEEKECAVPQCKGTCPDRAKFAEGKEPFVSAAYGHKLSPLEDAEEFKDFAPDNHNAPEVPKDFTQIIETIYRVNPAADFEKLVKARRLGEKRNDGAAIHEAVDDLHSNASLAHQLYLAAVQEQGRWEADAAVVMAGMRSDAMASLQEEKKAGDRSKAIAEADVQSKIAALYPQEFVLHREKSAKLKGLVEHLKNEAELWKTVRGSNVTTMLKTIRRP